MNTYPITAEQLYIEQNDRDENNPGCIACCKSQVDFNKTTPLSIKLQEEATKKWKEDQIAGYMSKRYDYPQYHWWMIQDGKKYLRSSKNFNVYDYSKSSLIVGTWNELTQRIEFTDHLIQKV